MIDGIFISLIVSLMFEGIPKVLWFRFFGGPITNKLVWIPLVIGVVYTLYCHYKYKNVFVDSKKFLKYIYAYFGIVLISLLVGLYDYPFYNEIQIRDNDLVIIGSSIGKYIISLFGISNEQFAVLLYIIRKLKFVVLETFWCFGGSYMIYCWYKNHYEDAINALFKGVIISAVLLSLFGVIETIKIFGNESAKQMLVTIAPYLHENATTSWGWPPKLWPNMRLVFCESSFMGNYLAFFLPCLYYLYNKKEKWYYLVFVYVFSFFTFLTKSRTCWGLMFGAIFLLMLFNLVWSDKKYFKRLLCVCLATVLSFGTYLSFLDISVIYKNNLYATEISVRQNVLQESSASNELINNMTNLAESNARSNSVRYGVMKANFRVFLEHPIFGVGSGLQSAYAANSYTEFEANLGEIKRWIAAYKKNGPFGKDVLQSGFNEYVDRLAQTGILGTIAFFLPFISVLITLLRIMFKVDEKKKIDIGFILMTLVCLLVSGFNVGLHIVYCIWCVLSIAYVIANENKSFIVR